MALKLVTLSTLYPSRSQPGNGVFVESKNRHLVKSGEVEIQVVAPVPWFPLHSQRFGKYGKYARSPTRDMRAGISIEYPRYLVLPKIGTNIAPVMMAVAILKTFKKLVASGYDFDLIDAYYFYPDGVAAALVGKWMKKPVVINALGTDINVIPRFRIPRALIMWAARHASAITTVSIALKRELLTLGVCDEKIHVNLHGVDHSIFAPAVTPLHSKHNTFERPKTLLCVGNLLEAKGQHLAIESLLHLKDFELVLVGSGEYEGKLKQQVSALNLEERVQFVGHVDHAMLPSYYSSSHALILPSLREGIPNVILESLACGTPVIATNVGGIPEIINSKCSGILIDQRSSIAIADAVNRLFEDYPSTQDVVQFSKQFAWTKTTENQVRILKQVV